jgi:hypothetical protein
VFVMPPDFLVTGEPVTRAYTDRLVRAALGR